VFGSKRRNLRNDARRSFGGQAGPGRLLAVP
jgi:hypothetical protein